MWKAMLRHCHPSSGGSSDELYRWAVALCGVVMDGGDPAEVGMTGEADLGGLGDTL